MSQAVLEVRGWRAVPAPNGGLYVYSNPYPDGFKGWAKDEETAKKWMEDASGLTYDNLPPLRLDDLEVKQGEKIRIGEFPNRGHWYRHTVYSYQGKELGRIQVKYRFKRYESLTLFGNGCVIGSDLRWLLKQNGYRLV